MNKCQCKGRTVRRFFSSIHIFAQEMSRCKLLCATFLLVISYSEGSEFLDQFKGLFDPKFGKAAPARDSPKTVDPNCVCGQLNTGRDDDSSARIIKGEEVKPPLKYPWMALVKAAGKFVCGGTLISTKFILTAARCASGRLPKDLEVVLGMHNIAKAKESTPTDLTGEPNAIKRSIIKVKTHGSYNAKSSSSPYDIALLKMSEPVTFTNQIKPLCLPKQANSLTMTSTPATVLGWGYGEDLTISDTLRELNVSAFDDLTCQKTGYEDRIVNEMMCASATGKSICDFDTGGPLFHKTSTTNTMLGIMSFSDGCNIPTFPGVYTRVSHFTNWIYAKARAGKYCKNPDNGQ